MAVQSDISSITYMGNNSTVTPYPVPFSFLDSTDLVLVATDPAGVDEILTPGGDYVVDASDPLSGGTIVTVFPIPTNYKVTIYRDLAATQTTSYTEGDKFPAKSHERALDKLTMLLQGALRAASRAVHVRESDGDMAPVAAAINTVLGFDGSGAPRTYTFQDLYNALQLAVSITNRPTKVVADSGQLNAAVPDFVGQITYRQDTASLYGATGMSAGNWTVLGLPGDYSISTIKLAAGILSADVAGRGKMAAGYFSADSTGRGKFASGFINNTLLGSDAVHAQTAKAVPVDADEILIADSAASFALKRATRLQLLPAGAVVGNSYAEYTANTNLSTQIPFDDTIPQITEGTEILSAQITPKATTHRIRVRFNGFAGGSNGDDLTAAIFLNGAANAICAGAFTVSNNNDNISMTLEFEHSPNSTSQQTYTIRVGPRTNNPMRMNGTTAARKFGGTARSTLILEEIKA